MSQKSILNWIMEHEGQSKREDYFDTGRKTHHIVRYENGDSMQYIETYESMTRKHTETIINNKTVREEDLFFHCFGWKSTTL